MLPVLFRAHGFLKVASGTGVALRAKASLVFEHSFRIVDGQGDGSACPSLRGCRHYARINIYVTYTSPQSSNTYVTSRYQVLTQGSVVDKMLGIGIRM